MKSVDTIIKQTLGRQLSQKEIERAKQGAKISSKRLDREYSIEKDVNSNEENIVIRTTNRAFMKTPDVSYGWNQPHEGFYAYKHKTEIYTKEGLLKEKSVGEGNFSHPLWGYLMAFNPPGKILGKIQNVRLYGMLDMDCS